MNRLLFLFFAIGLSAYSISWFDNSEQTDSWLQGLGILGPGILYSLFIIYCSRLATFRQKTVWFFSLIFYWLIAFMISIKTFGMFVPIFGGLSSWIIGRFLLLEKLTMRSSIVLLLLGFLSSAIGLTIYFILSGLENFGLQIVSIIILWQLSLGVVAIEPSLIGTNTTANSSSKTNASDSLNLKGNASNEASE